MFKIIGAVIAVVAVLSFLPWIALAVGAAIVWRIVRRPRVHYVMVGTTTYGRKGARS